MRQVHHLEQGSPEWHAHRATPNQINGSEIAAIMGLSSYVSRAELIRRKATGIEPEYDAATLKRFADGHANEAKARPLAEAIIDDDLSPLVITDTIDGLLISVSLDGVTQGYDTTFEHKSLNMILADALDAGFLPEEYHPQCESGLMVSGATRCLFMASKDGDPATARHHWYESRPELRPKIIAACKQFLEDKANYVHVEPAAPVVAAPIKDLPAIVITATGSLSVETNFDKWEIELRDFIKRIPEKPSTDQEFADCKAAVAAFKKAEAALDAEEARVLTMVPSVDDMRRHKKLLSDLSRTTRLALEKLVVGRDVDVKKEIMQVGKDGIAAYIKGVNMRLGGQYIPASTTNFADAIKNKRSYASMRDSVDAILANAKVEADMMADRIEANRKVMEQLCDPILFPDFAQVCTKQTDDFAALVAMRVSQDEQRKESAKKAEEARIAAAVEAERKAGEARAAAQQAANDQRGKADVGITTPACEQTTAAPDAGFVPVDVSAGNAASAASTPPTPETKRAAVVEAQDVIADFINSRNFGSTPAGTVRAILVEFVAYQAGHGMEAAA